MKAKQILATILTLVMIGCMAVPSFAAEQITVTAETTEWTDGNTYNVTKDITIDGTVTVTGNVTLNIADNVTLTVKGQDGNTEHMAYPALLIGTQGNQNSCLTITGSGTLDAIGGSGTTNEFTSLDGGSAIHVNTSQATLTIAGATVNATGGNGADAYVDFLSLCGGSGGNGIHVLGTLIVSGGVLNTIGGNGGNSKSGTHDEYGDVDGTYGGSGCYNFGNIAITGDGKFTSTAGSPGEGAGNGKTGSVGYAVNGGKLTAAVTHVIHAGESSSSAITSYHDGTNLLGSGSLLSGSQYLSIEKGETCYPITNGTPQSDETTNHGYLTVVESATPGNTILVEGTSSDLYNIARIECSYNDGSKNVTTDITKAKSFTMPAAAVNVTATFDVSGCYLDLEENDDTYLDTKTIEQPYTLTQNGVTEYVDVTKVKLEWTLPEISASYKVVNTWDPDNMKWVESKDTTALGEKEATFKFTNYSSVKVYAELSFKKTIGTGNSKEIVDSIVLDTVVNDDHSLKSGEVANGATFTHTYTPTASEFNSLSEGTGVYGTYTATLKKPVALTIEYFSNFQYLSKTIYAGEGAVLTTDNTSLLVDGVVVATTDAETDDHKTFYVWYDQDWNQITSLSLTKDLTVFPEYPA